MSIWPQCLQTILPSTNKVNRMSSGSKQGRCHGCVTLSSETSYSTCRDGRLMCTARIVDVCRTSCRETEGTHGGTVIHWVAQRYHPLLSSQRTSSADVIRQSKHHSGGLRITACTRMSCTLFIIKYFFGFPKG